MEGGEAYLEEVCEVGPSIKREVFSDGGGMRDWSANTGGGRLKTGL